MQPCSSSVDEVGKGKMNVCEESQVQQKIVKSEEFWKGLKWQQRLLETASEEWE